MRFTSFTICIVAPLLSLVLSVASSVIPSVIPSVNSVNSKSSTLQSPTVALPSDNFISMPAPISPKTGAPEGVVLDANQELQVKRILEGTSNETIIGLEPWYWPKAGCCKLHWDEVVDCRQGHKLFHFPADLKECEHKKAIWESCRMNIGYSIPDHQKWQVCYYTAHGTPPAIDAAAAQPPAGVGNDGSRLIGPADTGAMHCLTDLHWRHKYACIALAGSRCPISAAGGAETWIKTAHLEVTHRISAECSRTMQAAQDSLVGLEVSNVKVVVYATHQNWKVSEQIVFWGPGNWDSTCDKHLQGSFWDQPVGPLPLPGGQGGQGPKRAGIGKGGLGAEGE